MFKIEKNVKMPTRRSERLLYPWKKMKVGDSFVSNKIMHGACYNAGKAYHPKEFLCRKEDDNYRVWRMK